MGYLPGPLNFTIYQSADWRQPLQFNSGQASVTGSGLAPLNLTGYTGSCVLRTAPHQDPPLYTMTTSNGGIILNLPASGVLSLYIPASQTTQFTFPSAVYDLFLTDNLGTNFVAGDTIPFLTGSFKVKGNSP